MTQGLRLALNALLIVGVFAMHHLLLSASDGVQPHHDVAPLSQAAVGTVHAGASVVAEASAAVVDGGMEGALAACGDLSVLCLAIVLGATAFLMLRRRPVSRVLWQLPRAVPAGPLRVVAPFNTMSPLQRTSIQRC